ncbi:MAG: peptide deformylase [Bacteroidales bacterium]|jgi:peptide deformylase|nr:peptide deformylase [Bacteroidales bacterium]MDD4703641.1 peptide deformylase [Bacteroidales bacterium]MDX9797680.1 peptide deformylase [Bacteroidales bacterium]
MILPIVGYGNPVLRKVAQPIDKTYPELNLLIDNMFETMYNANGIGLAAPQIDLSIRLIVIDADPLKENYPEAEGFKKVFINPQIVEESGEKWVFAEGCLSLPELHEEVSRYSNVLVKYFDENFSPKEEMFSGVRARVFQHEYDHLEGKVFVDRLSPLRKTLLKRKLNDISNGKIQTNYKMKRPSTGRK